MRGYVYDPAISGASLWPAWMLDPASDESMSAQVPVPDGRTNTDIIFELVNSVGGSGDLVMRAMRGPTPPGTDPLPGSAPEPS